MFALHVVDALIVKCFVIQVFSDIYTYFSVACSRASGESAKHKMPHVTVVCPSKQTKL
jgi:hypothetical protein